MHQLSQARNHPAKTSKGRSSGYILISLMLFLSLLAIASLAVLPNLAFQVKRDREEELIHRGLAYSRGIKRFYKKFGRYPTRIEELENTNNLRFIRKRYKDPITGGDFKILHMADVGLTSLPIAVPGAATVSGPAGSPGPLQNPSGQIPVQTVTTNLNNPPGGTSGAPTNPQAGTASPDSSTSSEQSSPSTGGFSGPVFGGGPILGVASTSRKEAVREFCNRSHYNEWKFIYDPSTDLGAASLSSPWCPLAAGQGVGLNPNLTGAPRQQPLSAPQSVTPAPPPTNPNGDIPLQQ
jgi:type II secretory pathway pseudopilin PulG